jgi:5'-nucleotidase
MILLVNDDGIHAPGYRALYRALRAVTGEAVLAVAPSSERSGASHAITIGRSLAVTPLAEDGFFGFAIDGTPADCAKFALDRLCVEPPRLVVSGINDGPNVGRSIFYSGTVGAAMEAAVAGLSAFAVSRVCGWADPDDGAAAAAAWARRLLGRPGLAGKVVNLNLPAGPATGWGAAVLAPHRLAGFHEWYRPDREGGWRLEGDWRADPASGDDAGQLTANRPVLSLLEPEVNADPAALVAAMEAGR